MVAEKENPPGDPIGLQDDGTISIGTPEQMKAALLTHELTRIPNRRAYEDSEKKPDEQPKPDEKQPEEKPEEKPEDQEKKDEAKDPKKEPKPTKEEQQLTREQVMRLLDVLKSREEEGKKLQEQLRAARRIGVKKDW